MSHTLTWQDDHFAGVLCEGREADSIDAEDGWVNCSRCGQSIRLVWDVRIEQDKWAPTTKP